MFLGARGITVHCNDTYLTNINEWKVLMSIKNIVKEIQNMIDEHSMTNQDGRVRFMDFGASSLDIMILFK